MGNKSDDVAKGVRREERRRLTIQATLLKQMTQQLQQISN